jgi:hypothetical protein
MEIIIIPEEVCTRTAHVKPCIEFWMSSINAIVIDPDTNPIPSIALFPDRDNINKVENPRLSREEGVTVFDWKELMSITYYNANSNANVILLT